MRFTSGTLHPPFPSLSHVGIVTRKLDKSDEAAVVAFCQQCAAFFSLVAGETSAADSAHELLESRPASVDASRKHVIGFERSGTLVAIVDLLESYPVAADWYVGLLLLSPSARGQRLGTAVWSSVEEWIGAQGGRRARLVVQQQNPEGARFWRSVGFTAKGTVAQVLRGRTNTCWCFEKSLSGLTHERALVE